MLSTLDGSLGRSMEDLLFPMRCVSAPGGCVGGSKVVHLLLYKCAYGSRCGCVTASIPSNYQIKMAYRPSKHLAFDSANLHRLGLKEGTSWKAQHEEDLLGGGESTQRILLIRHGEGLVRWFLCFVLVYMQYSTGNNTTYHVLKVYNCNEYRAIILHIIYLDKHWLIIYTATRRLHVQTLTCNVPVVSQIDQSRSLHHHSNPLSITQQNDA